MRLGKALKPPLTLVLWPTSPKTFILPSALGTQEETLYRQAIMASWGWTMDQVVYIPQSQLESKVLGGNVTIKAGTQYLIRTASNSQLYRVSSDNNITPVNKADYSQYAEVIVPDAYWSNYIVKAEEQKPDLEIISLEYELGELNSEQNNAVFTVKWKNNSNIVINKDFYLPLVSTSPTDIYINKYMNSVKIDAPIAQPIQ